MTNKENKDSMYKPQEIIEELLSYLNMNSKQLASVIRSTPQTFYDIKSGKKKSISKTLADKICTIYPDINKDYLLTGEGSLLMNIPSSVYTDSRLYSILDNFSKAILINSEANRDNAKANLVIAESFNRLTKSCESLINKLDQQNN